MTAAASPLRAGAAGPAVLLIALVVAGCAARPTVPGTSVAWDRRARDLAALEAWTLNGRIGVRTPDGGGSGRMEWRQDAQATEIRLSGPFGAGGYEIRWDAASVTVTDGDGAVAAAWSGPAAIDAFVAERLGFAFPAGNARYWLLGAPAPGSRHREIFDDSGWLAAIEQAGWRVDYDGFVQRDGEWLPRRVALASDRGRLRVVVDDWRREGS